MSTNYPTSLDTSTTIPAESAGTPLSTNHVTAHQNIQDAIEAIEAKVGIDSSAVTTSHDYKLSGVTGSDKAVSKTGTETLTNKTLTSPVITSPTINLTSDAEGDTYYRNAAGAFVRLPRGTDNYILKMNGNVPNWEAETVTVAATDSVAGIGILATAAQITAGTASESSYPLVITPDQLALSTPVFNGKDVTGLFTGQYIPFVKSTNVFDTIDSDNFSYITTTDSTTTSGYCQFFMPDRTITSIQVLYGTGNFGTSANQYWNFTFKDLSSSAAVSSDSVTGELLPDDTGTIKKWATIPSSAYNGLTKGRTWNLLAVRDASQGTDTTNGNAKMYGILINFT